MHAYAEVKLSERSKYEQMIVFWKKKKVKIKKKYVSWVIGKQHGYGAYQTIRKSRCVCLYESCYGKYMNFEII